MSRYDDDIERRTANAQSKYEAWAKRERDRGNHETADRLHKKSEALGRTHGSGNRYSGIGGGGAPASGGCALVIFALIGLGIATPLALQVWAVLA